jgi:AcrR family transcriptional regulator
MPIQAATDGVGQMLASSDDNPGASLLARRRAIAQQNEDYQQRKKALLGLAAERFHAYGLGDTSFAEIARAAGLDRASIYYYFANKEELFAEVLRDAVADTSAQAINIVAQEISPAEKLGKLIVASMQGFDRHYPYLYVYVRDDIERLALSPTLKTELVKSSEAMVGRWRDVIVAGLEDGSFETSLPAGIVAWTLIGAVAWSHRWYEPGRSLGPAAIGEGLATLLVDGLVSRSKGPPRRRKPSGEGRP